MTRKWITVVLVGALAALMIQSCIYPDPHENFKAFRKYNIGKRTDDPTSEISRYPTRIVDSLTLPNGNREIKFRGRRDCRYFYEVDKVTNIIIGWRFEGKKKNCIINP